MRLVRRARRVAPMLILIPTMAFAEQSQASKAPKISDTANSPVLANDAVKQNPTQNQQPTQPPINVTITQPQPSAEELNRQRQDREREITIQEAIGAYTGWLVAIGALQFIATVGAFWVAWRAANAARDSADVAQATLHVTQRAYLNIVEVQFRNFGVGHVPRLVLRIKNAGHISATLTAWATTVATRDGLPAFEQSDRQWQPHSAVIAPDQVVTLETLPSGGMTPFTPAEWNDIQTGAFSIDVYGGLRYEAGFAITGELGFGFHFAPDLQHMPQFHRRFIASDVAGYSYAR